MLLKKVVAQMYLMILPARLINSVLVAIAVMEFALQLLAELLSWL